MERPLIYSVGEGAREVYYTRLTDCLVIKVQWNGDKDFVSDIPTDRLAVNIPHPVVEKIDVAFRVARKLAPEIRHLEAELGMARERESAARLAMNEETRKPRFGSMFWRKLKGA